MAAKSALPDADRPVLAVHDDGGNAVRIVDHGGFIYFEAQGRHDGQTVYTLVKVSRDRFVAGMLGWLL